MRFKRDSIVTPLPSIELIEEHEAFWSLTLPESFKEFMKNYNGVKVEGATFECNNRVYAIERFLCVIDDVEKHLEGIYDMDVVFSQIGDRLTDNEDLVGAEMLPIACVFAGDFICLNFRNNRINPSVCVWSHEESGEFSPVTFEVSEDFDGFLELLRR